MSSPTSEITLTVLNTESMTETIHGERRTTRWTTYVCLCGDGRITKLHDDEGGVWAIACQRCLDLWAIRTYGDRGRWWVSFEPRAA